VDATTTADCRKQAISFFDPAGVFRPYAASMGEMGIYRQLTNAPVSEWPTIHPESADLCSGILGVFDRHCPLHQKVK
jgi:hypothetical protein